jgi:uncharacterized protein YciI
MQQYLIYAKDYADALPRRMEAREGHLEGMRELQRRGSFLFGAALLNDNGEMIGSTLALQFDSQADFDLWFAQEPYVVRKVWESVEINKCKRAVIEE